MRAALRLSSMLLCLAALAGCATPYASTAPDNVTLQTQMDSGGLFSSGGAQFGIYRMSDKCPMEFLGWVHMQARPVHFGLPAGQKFYLRFVFTSSGSGEGLMTRNDGVILTSRHGARYLVKVSWVDGLSGARVQQVSRSGKVLHDFEHSPFPCPDADR